MSHVGVYFLCGCLWGWLSDLYAVSTCVCAHKHTHTHTHVGLKSDACAGGFTAALEKSEEARRDTPKYTSTRTILSPVVLSLVEFSRCVPSLHVSLTIFMYSLVYFYSC